MSRVNLRQVKRFAVSSLACHAEQREPSRSLVQSHRLKGVPAPYNPDNTIEAFSLRRFKRDQPFAVWMPPMFRLWTRPRGLSRHPWNPLAELERNLLHLHQPCLNACPFNRLEECFVLKLGLLAWMDFQLNIPYMGI